MMVRDTGAYLAQAGLGQPAADGYDGATLPKLHREDEDEEDDDNVRTQMRQLPKDALAAIVARASAGHPRAAAPAPAAAPAAAPPPVHFPAPGSQAHPPAAAPRPVPFPAIQARPAAVLPHAAAHAPGSAAFP